MNADALFERVTSELVAAIDDGAGAWRMPWHALVDAGSPTSIDGRAYRGMNALWLPMVAADRDWSSGLWATYRGWQRHDAQVRRGETATPVVLWKRLDTKPGNDSDDTETGERGGSSRLVARAFSVFAAEQVDGAEELIARRQRVERDTPERIDAAEAFFAAVGARVQVGGNQACYKPGTDTVHVPTLAQFDKAANFYGVQAHEHVHWTGAPSRLNRDLSGRFGSDAYAAEELVAELGAAMWCAQAGISAATREDHAAYLAGWLRVLRTDARALVTVTGKAQAAVDDLNRRAGEHAVALEHTEAA